MNDLHNLVEGSAKRHELFEFLQGDKKTVTLKVLSETRWACRVRAFSAMVETYSSVVTFLQVVDDDDHGLLGAKVFDFFIMPSYVLYNGIF